jgi:hypothetical protein
MQTRVNESRLGPRAINPGALGSIGTIIGERLEPVLEAFVLRDPIELLRGVSSLNAHNFNVELLVLLLESRVVDGKHLEFGPQSRGFRAKLDVPSVKVSNLLVSVLDMELEQTDLMLVVPSLAFHREVTNDTLTLHVFDNLDGALLALACLRIGTVHHVGKMIDEGNWMGHLSSRGARMASGGLYSEQ